ncbi:MAG: regulatory protein RecX [Candidatus Thiodiazotropha taylori]
MGRGGKLNLPDYSEIETAAVRLLAAREHSQQELRRKLLSRHYDEALIEQVLDDLTSASLQSDGRFAESFVESRVRKGQGPLRIRMELRERGISQALIDEVLVPYEDEWQQLLGEVHDAKYGAIRAESNKELAKRARFLESRGFPSEMIRRLLLD